MVVKSCFTFQLQQGETATRKWKLGYLIWKSKRCDVQIYSLCFAFPLHIGQVALKTVLQ